MTNVEATVLIIEIISPSYEAFNVSTPIAKLLSRKFPPDAGYRKLEGLDTIEQYEREVGTVGRGVIRYIIYIRMH